MKKLRLLLILCILGTSLLFSTNVLAFQVADNQVVYANKKWILEFTDAVGYDDLTKQAIVVTDSKGDKVNISFQLGNDNKSIIVYPPTEGYKPGESYTLKVGKQVHSAKGVQMKQDRFVHFSIEKIGKIEITSTALISFDGGSSGKVNYKVLDQNGNDITNSTTANNLTFQSGVGTIKGSNGVITITSPLINLNTLKNVQITILDSSNGVYASGIYTVESFEDK
ncbi:Ig-like domain-containing protein [Clostridium drakei]|uniref:SbsA Ig-like domain-containing protein n=1 Tax=Clostridium drakei TaxID=332101 RepID=A0A2U8DKS4_9CLOT|nr:Ig-like domain-containing protein [Clostridium drakei]AWI03075.1 hypothetical protein B9W14_00655 [Clostridium drakei]